MSKISVLVADDHPLVRDGIASFLQGQDGFEVVGQAADGEEAVKMVGELSPDVVIMDIEMPKVDGLEAMKQIKTSYPEASVLVLTVHDDEEYIAAVMDAGAAGYLLKSAYGEELIQAVRSVQLGEFVLSPQVGRQVLQTIRVRFPNKVRASEKVKLSQRELEVLKLVAHGMTNIEITNSLGINLRTVKSHLVDIFFKLGVGSRTEAIIACLRNGILSQEDLAQ